MPRGNGGVIGPANIPTTSVAKGVWSLMEQMIAKSQGIWPYQGYTIVQTFTATSTWTCPTGVTEVEYLVVAGGGGGGGATVEYLNGTPLNECILAAHNIVANFKIS